jgi:hypothetical protein
MKMARSTKDAWLSADAGDLEEAEVQDVPVKGQSVKIRALSATAANAATTSAISTEEVRGQTRMKVDSVKLDILRFAQGVVEPQFSQAEATIISGKFGKAFNKCIREINRLSGIDEDQVQEIEARFPGGSGDQTGRNGSGTAADAPGPDQHVRAGGKARTDG